MALRRVTGRRLSLRRVVFFQLRLLADALRDFVMSPVSILCFLLDFIMGAEAGEGYYDKLMHIGRRSDRLINLFEQHTDEEELAAEPYPDKNLDS